MILILQKVAFVTYFHQLRSTRGVKMCVSLVNRCFHVFENILNIKHHSASSNIVSKVCRKDQTATATATELLHWSDLSLDFVVIGVDGCGSTALHRHLRRHSQDGAAYGWRMDG